MGLMRYYLALSVIIAHFNLSMGSNIWWPTSSFNAVGGFFALSGFLVYRSYLNSKSLRTYIARRARRILPPYIFIVLLCAFSMVGLSTLSVSDYFASSQWWRYLIANLTFLNFLGPELPGEFSDHVITAVNGSLWTLKVEWMLYLSVPLVALLVKKSCKRPLYTFIAVYIFSMLYRLLFSYLYETHGSEIYNILGRQFFGQLMYFYSGVVIYFSLNNFLKYKWPILAGALILTALGNYIPYYDIIIGPITVSVIVLWFSLVGDWGNRANVNNFSYDIYLTHFPVIQVVVATGILAQAGLPATFAITMIGIAALGCISWFGIGKRFMAKRK
jgi:peptidoglycan/LPS O-acetylase OafA/YrhL